MVLLESLAAIGCVFLLWSLVGGLLRPRAAGPAVLVLTEPCSEAALEQSLRWIRFLKKTGLYSGEVLLVGSFSAADGEQQPLSGADQVLRLTPEALPAYFSSDPSSKEV